MDCPRKFHYIPGRLRIDIPGLPGNRALAKKIAHYLTRIPGIHSGSANPVSGRLLVFFNPDKITLNQLLAHVRLNTAYFNPTMDGKRGKKNRPKIKQASMCFIEDQIAAATAVSPIAGTASRNVVGLHTPGSTRPWHTLKPSEVLTAFQTKPDHGLQPETALKRLQYYGHNELAASPPPSFAVLLWAPLQGFMSKLLLTAAAVSLLVGESADALVIVAIVGLQAILEAFQGFRAEKSLTALKELSAPTARVVRGGILQKISARDLVPGDVIEIKAGDKVPADAHLLESSNLTTDEASLTGESIPVPKNIIASHRYHVSTGDQENMIFSGTSITSGRARAIIVATGMNTEMGKIAGMLKEVRSEVTPLQRRMEWMGQKITRLVVASVGAISIISLARGNSLLNTLRTGVSLAVGAIPEGMPAIVTVALAFGVQRMARRKAIVRRLSAVEALGSTTVICSDKTGTLTKNEMTVKEIYCGGQHYYISGEGYQPEGGFLRCGYPIKPKEAYDLTKTLITGILCNNAVLYRDKKGWQIQGDPTEAALLTAAAKAGLWWKDARDKLCREREIAFDSSRRMMTVICNNGGDSYTAYTKGATGTLLNHCTKILKNGIEVPLEPSEKKRILATNNIMANKALRVLGLAYRNLELGEKPCQHDLEHDLVFAGLAGMVDPPRPGVKKAIHKCRGAGIKVIMITGDHKNTATAIARELDILRGGAVITGRMLDNISEYELLAAVENIQVFARTSPEQKLRIVRALKKRGHIVAMTGDGVNDAPAVKEADIGLSMGLAGTDVTREVAGITLVDDNFSTIVAGIEEGRTVGENIDKSIRYVLSGNAGQVLAVFLAAISGLPSPLLPAQLLWTNLVTEGFPAMALAADPPSTDCMRRRSMQSGRNVLNSGSSLEIIRKGILSGITTFGVYAGGLSTGWLPGKARTMAFAHLVMSRVFNLFDSQRINHGRSAAKTKNHFILPAAGLSTAMLALTMYAPCLQPLFSTVPMGVGDWALIGVTSGIAGRMDSLLRGSTVINKH
ncbi:MAG: cation-translocating P-type ATPase [Peptococcaceae bacterium]|nr:cation-translocating P-type ATPase [Peptococcaceae bacterium]